MNTNPHAHTVLCFGDSNTWGQRPDMAGRYAANIRWTGVLQSKLGDSYYVIEEGLGGRTTDIDHGYKMGRNGKEYLVPCLDSHSPLDTVIIMLGTNDLKAAYNRTAEDIGQALTGLLDVVGSFSKNKDGGPTQVILVSPIHINSDAPYFSKYYTDNYNGRSVAESKKLVHIIKEVASSNNCLFVDAATVAKAGEDGIHFDEPSEARLADLLYQTIIG